MKAFLVDEDVAVSGYEEFLVETPFLIYIVEFGTDVDPDAFKSSVIETIAWCDDAPPFRGFDVEIGEPSHGSVACSVFPK